MNLIQVQEHLKDLPMRVIMEYANGKSTQVPPYLALGELNRRKQMEQSAKTAQPPQGTVKDKIEQEVTGGQPPNPMQSAMQGQPAPMAMPQQQPQMPEGAEPMPQMAGGGLTALPVGDMFKFAAGGGVVAFADGDVVVDEFSAANPAFYDEQLAVNRVKNEDRQRLQRQKELDDKIKFLETAAPEVAERLKREQAPKSSQAAAPAKTQQKTQQSAEYDPATATRRVDFMQPPPAPAAGIPAAIGMPKVPTFEKPDVNAYSTQLAAFKKANPGAVGSEFQGLLDKLAQQDEEDRAKFLTQEKGRTRADFWQALIDAGESTRGQKGLGALFGGFGRSAIASQAKADERANAQAKMRRDQELNMAKMRAELEAARRAEARGDFEAAFKHKQDADKIARDIEQTQFSNRVDLAKLAEQARGNTIQASTAARAPALIQMAQEIQRQNEGMTFNEALERASVAQQGAQYQNADARRQQAIDKAYQEERPFDPKMIEFMTKDPAEKKRMLKENEDAYNRIRARFGVGTTGQQTDPNAPTSGFSQARIK
jgi:hypothetical protein